jgi:hypothetical protein
MKSEIIVVLVFIALAVGFILWVRSQSQPHPEEAKPQGDQVGQDGRSAKQR